MMAAAGDDPFWKQVKESSGDPRWDGEFRRWRESLSKAFGVSPALFFYNDGDSKNAFAVSPSRSPHGEHGTVCIGINLLRDFSLDHGICLLKIANAERIKGRERSGLNEGIDRLGESVIKGVGSAGKGIDLRPGPLSYAEATALHCNTIGFFVLKQPLLIAAHEFGHILQFKNGLRAKDQGWILEPHADFMAGWFMRNIEKGADRRIEFSNYELTSYADTMSLLGDKRFADRRHHGEPEFRATMVRTGYDAGELDVDAAFRKGKGLLGI
jgi:hypothetical protein